MAQVHHLERLGIVLGVVLVVALPIAHQGWPMTAWGNLVVALLLAAGCSLTLWRNRPRAAAALSLGLLFAVLLLGGDVPDLAMTIFSAGFAVLALGWSGRAAFVAGGCGLLYLGLTYVVAEMDSWVAALMFSVPPFAAGTILRLRSETADALARRVQELEDERELYADLALRHERARIASELHDIVGHAISVMVIQAAAGQRLVEADPARARETFETISDSARRGIQDLEHLIDLLSGSDQVGSDLSLVDEVATRAARAGLNVTCRVDGDRDAVPEIVAQLAFRVVQEALTNALRYAPGANVLILIDACPDQVSVRVENDRSDDQTEALAGGGSGLIGLRERVHSGGGRFTAGRTLAGGWLVEARFPPSAVPPKAG